MKVANIVENDWKSTMYIFSAMVTTFIFRLTNQYIIYYTIT